jgi:hypothetical protein
MLPRKYILVAIVGLLALASSATATPWWVTYEGNDYPENEGWAHYIYGGGAQRYLVDGSLVIDSLASRDIADNYAWTLPTLPASGEAFRAEWRLRVDDTPSLPSARDPALGVGFAGHGDVLLSYEEGGIYSVDEVAWIATIEPGVFHDYVLTFANLDTYTLAIDGTVVWAGEVVPASYSSYIGWGDCRLGATSLSTWDYVRFGVVPEPASGVLIGSVLGVATALRTRNARRNYHAIVEAVGTCVGRGFARSDGVRAIPVYTSGYAVRPA